MNDNATGTNVSSENGELKVKRVRAEEVDKSQAMGEWNVKMGAIYLEVNGKDVEIAQDAGDTDTTGNKKNKYMRTGSNMLIMRFKEKIKDIVDGVTLKLKGGKDKEDREDVDKKKVVKKVVKKTTAQQTKREDNEK